MDSNLERETERILQGFQSTWSYDGRDFNKPSSDQVLHDLINEAPQDLRARLVDEFFGLGPLTALLSLESLQEIIVVSPSEIWFECAGQLRRHPDAFAGAATFKNFVDRICLEAKVKIDLCQPFVDGRWRDFRLHIGCAPLTHSAFHINLRKFPKNPWTLESLCKAGWTDANQLAKLKSLLAAQKNFIVVGPTGSGKTTVLGASLKTLPENERVVIIEDTDELERPNSASTKLLTRQTQSQELPMISLSELVRQSLRMRPSRLVLGEVRGAEAKDLLLALATGHSGSLGTLHASDARQALLRLEMLVQMGAPQWSLQSIRQLIQLSIDAIVVCGLKNGQRSLDGIYRVAALESFGFLLEPY